jgi:3-hydroxyacyl-CoA dehydrogenase/enoyl-CoA hydratase/3-hydroxybutyryl-CoA epimerase
VFEELALKRKILAEVESVTGPDSIFASNTSTIPIHEIAAEARRPDRVLGMHFFSPVEKMPLLEVIPTDQTAPEAIVTAVRFGRRMGKTVIVVGDRPGFWVNRILSPYLNEAGTMVAEGIPIELIDRTATAWGFPVGPVALLDEIGLDVAQKAAETMREAYGERMKSGSGLDRLIGAGRLGRKNGRGFYRYGNGRKKSPDRSIYPLLGARLQEGARADLIERRLVFAMLNEAAAACAEGVVRSPRDGDIGAIYGIGFPAFRGGPLRLIDDLGAASVLSTLHDLQDQYGERFRPTEALAEMARQGGRYYPA